MKKYLSLFAAMMLSCYLAWGSPVVFASQARKAYAAADARLNKVYRELSAKIVNIADSPKGTLRDRQQLTNAERAWVNFRDADVNFYGRFYTNSKGGLFIKTKLTQDRSAYLE